MSVYKDLSPSDVGIRVFYAHKQFVFTQNDTDLLVIPARQITGSHFYSWLEITGSGGVYQRTLYDSIKHLYYNESSILEHTASNLYTGMYNDISNLTGNSKWSLITKFYDPYKNFGSNDYHGGIYKNLGSHAVVISIPQQYFGERLKPGFVHVEDVAEGFTLVDDKKGNLYNSIESASFAANKNAYHRGNVFYEHGNIVITSLSSSYQNFGTGSNNIVVKFRSSEKVHELEAICTANEGEFNMTMNPSARVSRSLFTSEPLGFVTGSDFTTYPTTVGLYNNEGALLAVGKLPQPLRNDPNMAITIALRIYW